MADINITIFLLYLIAAAAFGASRLPTFAARSGILFVVACALVAVGISVAAGCMPCTDRHVTVARKARASDDEIRQAVATERLVGMAKEEAA